MSSLAGSFGAEKPAGIKRKGIDYKWIVLSITTIEMFMVSVNGSIILISLPAIFDGINIDPLTSFQYLIWVLMGYNLVTATLLLSFGRLSDMYGRVKLYNVGFAIFTLGSICFILLPTPVMPVQSKSLSFDLSRLSEHHSLSLTALQSLPMHFRKMNVERH